MQKEITDGVVGFLAFRTLFQSKTRWIILSPRVCNSKHSVAPPDTLQVAQSLAGPAHEQGIALQVIDVDEESVGGDILAAGFLAG